MSEAIAAEEVKVDVLGRVAGFSNPESSEMLPDGETIVVSNAAISIGLEDFRGGGGIVYRVGDSYTSLLRYTESGLELVRERVIEGLTGTLGTDNQTVATNTYPLGTVFAASGGNPMTVDGKTVLTSGPQVRPQALAYDPIAGVVLPPVPLWEGTELAKRFNAFEQPNGLAVGLDGDLYVTDIPNSNPDGALPSPVPAAVYRFPHESLDALAAGEAGAADGVERIVMEGWVNGVTVSPVDGSVWVVSCSAHCPVGGGAYRLTPEDFASGVLPEPQHRDLGGAPGGFLDGVTVTRRGSVVVSNPATAEIFVMPADGGRLSLKFDGVADLGSPADINVCYPKARGGEPALLVPDVSPRGGTNTVSLLDLSGY
ncbi:hypothetical protein [Rhodococcus opacus]|uniref:ScyD/ScyE family protein n=1 Tax=Rhodococcus opacus TaxID=37919 RepID=A0A2S8J4L3_RHOOP|nr:hypothetical protein [Rhodococcus opacus]PQP21968.1 hypothetical protein C5613_24840 [Rhodococcus opacus]